MMIWRILQLPLPLLLLLVLVVGCGAPPPPPPATASSSSVAHIDKNVFATDNANHIQQIDRSPTVKRAERMDKQVRKREVKERVKEVDDQKEFTKRMKEDRIAQQQEAKRAKAAAKRDAVALKEKDRISLQQSKREYAKKMGKPLAEEAHKASKHKKALKSIRVFEKHEKRRLASSVKDTLRGLHRKELIMSVNQKRNAQQQMRAMNEHHQKYLQEDTTKRAVLRRTVEKDAKKERLRKKEHGRKRAAARRRREAVKKKRAQKEKEYKRVAEAEKKDAARKQRRRERRTKHHETRVKQRQRQAAKEKYKKRMQEVKITQPAEWSPKQRKLRMHGYSFGTKRKMKRLRAYTWSFWVNPQETTGNWANVFHKGANDAQRNPAVWFYPGTTRLHVRSGTARTWNAGTDPARQLPLHHWTHVALTHDRGGHLRVYIDGQLHSHVRVGGPVNWNNGPLWTSNPWYPSAHVDVAALRMFPRALTASEIPLVVRSSRHP